MQAVRIGPNVRTSVDFPARSPTDNSLRFCEPRSICRCGSTHGAGCGERSWDDLVGLEGAGTFGTTSVPRGLCSSSRPSCGPRFFWHRRIHALRVVADGAHLDVRHREASLVRFTLAYRDMRTCPGSARAGRRLARRQVRRAGASARRTPFAGIIRIRYLGVTDRSQFLSLLRLPRRLADFTNRALNRQRVPRAGSPYSTLQPVAERAAGRRRESAVVGARATTSGGRARRTSRTVRPDGPNASRRTIGDGRMLR
jgi:hypothetical protein